jgi:HupE / UreJ protein
MQPLYEMTHCLPAFLFFVTTAAVVPKYFTMGFTHILPGGVDHILFILGLFFLTRDLSTLLFRLTLFTLAHSLTLGLSVYGIVSAPTQVVELAIAMSIALIAIGNSFRDYLSQWLPAIVFGFGLIHGLGFAHAFGGSPPAPADFLPALFSFNLGIEIGQLTVVGLAYAAVAAWWKRDGYREVISRTASAVIAVSGLYWALERSFL